MSETNTITIHIGHLGPVRDSDIILKPFMVSPVSPEQERVIQLFWYITCIKCYVHLNVQISSNH